MEWNRRTPWAINTILTTPTWSFRELKAKFVTAERGRKKEEEKREAHVNAPFGCSFLCLLLILLFYPDSQMNSRQTHKQTDRDSVIFPALHIPKSHLPVHGPHTPIVLLWSAKRTASLKYIIPKPLLFRGSLLWAILKTPQTKLPVMLIQALINRGLCSCIQIGASCVWADREGRAIKSDSHYREEMVGGVWGNNEERFDWRLFISIVMENVILLIWPLKEIKA